MTKPQNTAALDSAVAGAMDDTDAPLGTGVGGCFLASTDSR